MPHRSTLRTTPRLLAGVVLSATALFAAGMTGPTGAGASGTGYSRGVKVTAPPNAAHNPRASLYGVSCKSKGNCTAVGEYIDSSNHQQALAATESSAAWGRGTEVVAPTNAAHNPEAVLQDASCTSPGDCAAVGDYTNSSSVVHAMAATEASGKWSRAIEVSATTNGTVLNAVWCSSAGNCVAVGSSGDATHAIVATETSGKWGGAVAVQLPANAAGGSSAFALFQGLSCPSKGNCTAVGIYGGNGGTRYGLIAAEANGKWAQAIELTELPTGASGSWADLIGVSCTSVGHCTAVGSYADGAEEDWPMIATETSGKWARATEASLPVGANTGSGGPSSQLDAVVCTSVGNCADFGVYNNSNYYSHDMVAIEAGGKWVRATQLLAPTGSVGESTVYGGSGTAVACVIDSCVAVGGYGDASGNDQAMAAAGTI